jgi:hypothetical protein
MKKQKMLAAAGVLAMNVPRDEYAVARAKREALVGGFRAKGKGYGKRDRTAWKKGA